MGTDPKGVNAMSISEITRYSKTYSCEKTKMVNR